jgi:hypothetical protein
LYLVPVHTRMHLNRPSSFFGPSDGSNWTLCSSARQKGPAYPLTGCRRRSGGPVTPRQVPVRLQHQVFYDHTLDRSSMLTKTTRQLFPLLEMCLTAQHAWISKRLPEPAVWFVAKRARSNGISGKKVTRQPNRSQMAACSDSMTPSEIGRRFERGGSCRWL